MSNRCSSAIRPSTVVPVILVALLMLSAASGAWAQEETASAPVGRAQRISLNLQDVTLGNVLKVMTQKSGINFLIGSDLVGKRINVYLEDVLVEDALAAIMRANGMWYTRQKGTNIYVIMDAPEGPPVATVTEIVHADYADAAELLPTLEGVLTEAGTIVVDPRTNSLVISDIPENMNTLQSLAEDLDEPTGQILIQAKIVEIDAGAERELGVEWEFFDYQAEDGNSYGTTFNTDADAPGIFDLTFGKFESFTEWQDLKVRIAAMKKDGLIEPQILTLDNMEAYIGITERIALARKVTYHSSEGGGGSTVEPIYGDIGITLRVTPHINNDEFVTMKIEPIVAAAQKSLLFPNDAVDTKSRTAVTTVMAKNKQTIVIGGLLRTDIVETHYKVPLLGDIPLLGALFRKTATSEKKTEIMVFLTPQILGAEELSRMSERLDSEIMRRFEEN